MAQKGGFPWLPASAPAPEYFNSFKYNVLDFLKQYGQLVPLKLLNTTAFIVTLRHKTVNGPVKLHVYEEHIDEDSGAPPTCDQCRNMGRREGAVGRQRLWRGRERRGGGDLHACRAGPYHALGPRRNALRNAVN